MSAIKRRFQGKNTSGTLKSCKKIEIAKYLCCQKQKRIFIGLRVNKIRKKKRNGESPTLNKMLMPRFIKGLVKSMTISRAQLIVIDPTARSAFCNSNKSSVLSVLVFYDFQIHAEVRGIIQKEKENDHPTIESYLFENLTDDAVPFASFGIESPVLFVGHHFNDVIETNHS